MLTYDSLRQSFANNPNLTKTKSGEQTIVTINFYGFPFVVGIISEEKVIVTGADKCDFLFPEFKNPFILSMKRDGKYMEAPMSGGIMSAIVKTSEEPFEPLDKDLWVNVVKTQDPKIADFFSNLMFNVGPQMYMLPFTGSDNLKAVPYIPGNQHKILLTGKKVYGFPIIKGANYWMPIIDA